MPPKPLLEQLVATCKFPNLKKNILSPPPPLQNPGYAPVVTINNDNDNDNEIALIRHK